MNTMTMPAAGQLIVDVDWNAGGSPASTCEADEPSALQLFIQSLTTRNM